MKQLFTLIVAIVLIVPAWAQSPQMISYQALIRDSQDALVADAQIGIQISILLGSANGEVVYTETHNPTTNTNGLVTLEIGNGTSSGDFSDINWAEGKYFIKTETDPAGGTDYTITGTSQLLSVPYALHAGTADSLSGPLPETDPLFSASAASGINESDTSAWNRKLDQEMDGDPENEMQSFSVSGTGDTLFLSKSNYVIVPGISEANSGGDGGSGDLVPLHEPALEIQFDDDPYNHNMHIASDGDHYYTVNGGDYQYGRINKYTLAGEFVATYDIDLDFRSIMYNPSDGYFYGCGFEAGWNERNIYKITSIEEGTFERLYTNLYDYEQASTAMSSDGQFIYAFDSGTLKKYRLSDGELVETLTGFNHGSGNYGGDGAVAVDPDYIYTWDASSRTVYVYDHSGSLQQTMALKHGDNGHSLSFVDGYLFVSVDGDYSTGTWYGYNIRKPLSPAQPISAKSTPKQGAAGTRERPKEDSTQK